jgi:argininosuccinate lyase
LYAADAALALAREGVPFREAYRRVAADLRSGDFDPRTAAGDGSAALVPPPVVHEVEAELTALQKQASDARARIETAEARLLPE